MSVAVLHTLRRLRLVFRRWSFAAKKDCDADNEYADDYHLPDVLNLVVTHFPSFASAGFEQGTNASAFHLPVSGMLRLISQPSAKRTEK